jgi:hypothetical protein
MYWFLKYIRGFWLQSTVWEIFFAAVFAGTHLALYLQILDHAANHHHNHKSLSYSSSRSSARGGGGDATSLVGGHWLDVLAVVTLIQMTTAFSTKAYWLLLLLPVWGAWSLYQSVMGKQGIVGSMTGSNSNNNNSNYPAGNEMTAPINRKQRRAEQKNQRK